MNKKCCCVIEVKVPYRSERWQNLVNNEVRQAIEKLRAAVEELGGKVCVRY